MTTQFDAVALANDLFAEARAYAVASSWSEGNKELDLTDEQKLARMLAEAPLPDEQSLARVISEVFWASMLAEEGRPCRPRVVFSPGVPAPTHEFKEPRALTSAVLRKLSPAHGGRDCFVWEVRHGEPMLTGIELRPRFHVEKHRGVVVAGVAAGAIDLLWNSVRLVTLRAGGSMRHSTCGLGDLYRVVEFVAKTLAAPDLFFASQIVEKIISEGHGGSLWLVKDTGRLNGIDIGSPVATDGNGLSERFPRAAEERLYGPWMQSVARLAAVDGAVIADTALRLLGFGAFIRNLDDDVTVAKRVPGGKAERIESLSGQGWGGRHRSAIAFCARNAPAAAFVVSEDGGITAVVGDGSLVWCEPVVSLGYDI